MISTRRGLLPLLATLSAAACAAPDAGRAASSGSGLPAISAPIERAVALAVEASAEARKNEPYRVVGAQELAVEGEYVWRVTFKPTRLLPADPGRQPIGLGGEVFVHVQLATGATEIRLGQ